MRPRTRAAAGWPGLGVRALLLVVLGVLMLHETSRAQVPPHERWRTLRTPHFRVHFTPPHEELARRAAASAEEAYARLAEELHPPRGTIDLVVADNVDYSNGYATPAPSNRIVIYAHPPAEGQSLRYFHDWSALLITHELTHIFHLDRTRGWWRVAQHIFGRNPLLFPNFYQPRWITEGLAVYYETRLTGFGRLAGSEHRMLAHAAASTGALPRLDELSLATGRFPGGQAAYAYGSLLFEHLATTRGPESIPAFVERSSGYAVPFLIERAARRSFGVSFTGAWREWSDSIGAAMGEPHAPIAGWRPLVTERRFVLHPRWESDDAILFSAATGREPPGLYRVDLAGDVRRLARRNGLDANVPGPHGVVTAQIDYTSPFHVRSDLYIAAEPGARERRWTTGARLTLPDVRHDGAVVAVRAGGGAMQLVRWDASGSIRALTSAHPDTLWSEPRWSPDGARLAAVRWARGGTSEIVVLDSAGAPLIVLARDRAVNSSPSWSGDGRLVVYSSDRSGTSELYAVVVPVSGEPPRALRLSDAGTGLFQPELSPDGRWLAAVHFTIDGHHIGVAPFDTTRVLPDEAAVPAPHEGADPLAPAGRWAGPVSPYRAWRTALPRFWVPTVLSFGDVVELGGFTEGADVIGRHSWTLSAWARTDGEYHAVDGSYRWAGLGVPVIEMEIIARREPFAYQDAEFVESERTAVLAVATFRPRIRSRAWGAAGVETTRFVFARADGGTSPFTPRIDRHGIFLNAGVGTASWPALAISPQDGISLNMTGRYRQVVRPDETAYSTQLTGTGSGYRSLDLPGFARHVVAARLAGGWTDQQATGAFSIGGVSGNELSLVPGLSLGEGRRTFGVRGFDEGTLAGIRAATATLEYRAPLTLPARGWRTLPLFLDRTSVSVFSDAGTAWCPRPLEGTRGLCPAAGIDAVVIGAVGAELTIDAAVLDWDFPYRFRLGAAAPVVRRDLAPRRVTPYVTLGSSF